MDTCKKIECHRSRYNNFTVFCEKHKCSHCYKEAVGESNIACVEHENYEGGPMFTQIIMVN